MTTELKNKITRSSFAALIFILFMYMFWPFFTALLMAALFAFALHDLVLKLTFKKISTKFASLLLITGVLVFLAAPLIFIVLKTISTVKTYSQLGLKNTSIYLSTETLLHNITDYTSSLALRFNFDVSQLPKPTEFLSQYSDEIGAFTTHIIAKLPAFGLNVLVFFLALYYFLNESAKVKNIFLKLNIISEAETNKIISVIKNSSYLTLVASVVIGVVQSLVVSVFAYFCGFTDFFIVFIVTFIFSLIPVVGAGPVALFLVLISFIQGSNTAVFAMLVATVISASIDNLLKPMILNSSDTEIHPIVSLLALIGGILAYGAAGILLGPILTQLAHNIVAILTTEEISGEIVADATTTSNI